MFYPLATELSKHLITRLDDAKECQRPAYATVSDFS